MKSKSFFVIFALFLGLSLVSCTGTQQGEPEEAQQVMDMAQVRQSIEDANVKFGEAVRSGDAAALASLYAEEATIMPPESEMIKGREAIQEFWAGGLQMGIKDVVLTTLDVVGMGDVVCEIGQAEISILPEGMDELHETGKYVVIWKKSDDGAWQLYVDIWNTNSPAM